MTPGDFIRKWQGSTLSESEGYQVHFTDLCRLLGEPAPYDPDTDPDAYGYQRGAIKTTGAPGWADVWKRGHFGWEYKGPGKNLRAAYDQLQQYAGSLDNPPLLIVSNWEEIHVHTRWTNLVHRVHQIRLQDLADPNKLRVLKWAFAEPERLRPDKTRQDLTEEAAGKFAALATRLRGRGHDPQAVAHFLNRLVFCMFAEGVGLLQDKLFRAMMEQATRYPAQFEPFARKLFAAMQSGGWLDFRQIDHFNGGLFNDDSALPLDADDLKLVLDAARLDWSDIDPSILGTLFERGLDPDKRSQLGAHYTDRDKIMKIVEPVILRPLEAEWAAAKAKITAEVARAEAARARRPENAMQARRVHRAARQVEERALKKARQCAAEFLDRLRTITVLDPACGSGNFLYLTLHRLKDLEHRVQLDLESFGVLLGYKRTAPGVRPEQLYGIEISSYAAELARVSVWIGDIQWLLRNGFPIPRNPILRPLDTIESRDALLNPEGTEATWPEAEFIIGNPPFLGGKFLRSTLGDAYVEQLFAAFRGRTRPECDLVCYWSSRAGRPSQVFERTSPGWWRRTRSAAEPTATSWIALWPLARSSRRGMTKPGSSKARPSGSPWSALQERVLVSRPASTAPWSRASTPT